MDTGDINYSYASLFGDWGDTQKVYSKVIFVSGPYRDPRGEYYVNQNIQNARMWALSIWRMGGVALCPHLNTMLFGGAEGLGDHVWLRGDLELLSRCDAIFFVPGWQHSEGCRKEFEFAMKHNIVPLNDLEDLGRFLLG